MPDFTSSPIESDVYFRISDVQIPSVPAGVFIPVLIGLGSKTLQTVEQLTKGGTDSKDGPLSNTPVINVLSIIDSLGNSYTEGTEFTFAKTGADAWKIVWVNGQPQPTNGSKYSVTYEYEKTTTDYDPIILSSTQDVVTRFGPPQISILLDSGTATSGTVTTLVDNTKTWTVNGYVGNYVKIISGTGAGQSRVIISNDATSLSVSDWGTIPDATSVYQITDISENSISLAAQILYENTGGNGFVYCVQSIDDTSTDFQAALDKMQDKDGAYVIVILKGMTLGDPLITSLKTHVDTQSTTLGKHERIALIGGPVSLTDYQTISSIASGIADSRLAFIAPCEGKRSISGTEYSFDGSYIAAAIAGIITNPVYDAAEPISGKTIVGFNDIPNSFLLSQIRYMIGSGVFLITKERGIPAINHALSTDVSTVVNSEIKITRIKDYIIDLLRRNLRSTYINARNLGTATRVSMKAFIKFLLDGAVTRNILTDYQNLEVIQNTSDPRQIDVTFQVRPIWDINYIYVTFGVTFP